MAVTHLPKISALLLTVASAERKSKLHKPDGAEKSLCKHSSLFLWFFKYYLSKNTAKKDTWNCITVTLFSSSSICQHYSVFVFPQKC